MTVEKALEVLKENGFEGAEAIKVQKDLVAFAEEMKNYEQIKDRLVRIVLNISNKDRYAMIPINDSLGYAFKIFINDEMSVTVTNQHIEQWGVDADKLYIDSKVKETVIKPLNLVMNEMAPEEMKFMFPVDENDPMLLVSNVNIHYGAVNIFEPEVMRQIHDRFGNDFVVLPSSVHEVLCVDTKSMQDDFVETAKKMVQEVNSTEVLPDEVLANIVYTCDGKTLKEL